MCPVVKMLFDSHKTLQSKYCFAHFIFITKVKNGGSEWLNNWLKSIHLVRREVRIQTKVHGLQSL